MDFLEANAPLPDLYDYYDCCDYPFNFQLLNLPLEANTFANVIDDWISNVPGNSTPNWVVSILIVC